MWHSVAVGCAAIVNASRNAVALADQSYVRLVFGNIGIGKVGSCIVIRHG